MTTFLARHVPPSVALLTCLWFSVREVNAGQSSVHPIHLRCDHLQDPLGLDQTAPQLSWQLEAASPEARGQRQTGWQVRIASSATHLTNASPDLWQPDWETNQAQQVVYQGRPLNFGDSAHWQVRVKDEAGVISDWSEIGQWSIGPLHASDWRGRWIGAAGAFERKPGQPPPDNTMPDPWLRRTFDLPARPERALLYVASIGYHEVYINGERVGDRVLEPCVSDLSKRARYVTYDITDHLRSGRNALGLWLGTSWSIYPHFKNLQRPLTPMVLAQADIELTNGERIQVVTDERWKVHPSPNTLLGVWDFMNFGGELYDARKELPDWRSPSHDDSAWLSTKVYEPGIEVSAARIEPNRKVHELRAVSVQEINPLSFRIDMGTNFAGWVEIPLRGKPGDQIEILWSEHPDKEMTHRLRSVYIIGPTGTGVFCNRFNYGAGRWITLKGLTTRPEPDKVRGWTIRTDYKRTSSFRCSNDLLNRIYDTALWTFENLSLGGYVVDCPQRERMGYGGDAHATTETALDNFRMPAFYAKWAQDWRDVQGRDSAWGVGVAPGQAGAGEKADDDGNLPYTAPTYWGGGGPAWSGYCVTLPWEVYRREQDVRILEDNFKMIERWLAFTEARMSDGLLRRWGGQWDFLGDWLWPGAKGVNGDTRETLFFNNCYLIYNLDTASRIAEVLGKTSQAQEWRRRADQVRQTVHREFFNPDDASYVNGFQAYLAIALLTDVPPPEFRDAVARRLEHEIREVRNNHFWGGITGGYFIVKWLIEANRPDLMYAMVSQEDYPSWGDMFQRGATTFWEDWEGNLSQLHSSYLHVGSWFIQGLAGIRPGPEGYRHFTLRPGIWDGCPLSYAKASLGSPFGPIESAWHKENGHWKLEYTVPPGTRADLLLPEFLQGDELQEAGRPLNEVPGVEQIQTLTNGSLRITLGPGRYNFGIVTSEQPPSVLDVLPMPEELGRGWERRIPLLMDPLSKPPEIIDIAGKLPESKKQEWRDSVNDAAQAISGNCSARYTVNDGSWTGGFTVEIHRFRNRDRLMESFDGLQNLKEDRYERETVEGLGEAAVAFSDHSGMTVWFRRGLFRVWIAPLTSKRLWNDQPALQHLARTIDAGLKSRIADERSP